MPLPQPGQPFAALVRHLCECLEAVAESHTHYGPFIESYRALVRGPYEVRHVGESDARIFPIPPIRARVLRRKGVRFLRLEERLSLIHI